MHPPRASPPPLAPAACVAPSPSRVSPPPPLLPKEEFGSNDAEIKARPEKAGEKAQLKHFWFVLFSNGILMYFSDPSRAVLGQALGF